MGDYAATCICGTTLIAGMCSNRECVGYREPEYMKQLSEEEKMQPVLRCKMRVSQVSRTFDHEGKPDQEQVKLTAVYSSDPKSENAQWSKWTPSADFNIHINNPNAFGALTKDHEFFVDFIPANQT